MRKAATVAVLVLLAIGVALWFRSARRAPAGGRPPGLVAPPQAEQVAPAAAKRSRIAVLQSEIGPDEISPIANDLDSPTGSARHDVEIVNAVFEAWQTNFPGHGNPVGENDEITAALAGDNPLRFAFVSPRNRAIDRDGQLCDRWGHPFRFHQLSGTAMEVWSAGPDGRFGNADDVRFTPATAGRIAR